MDLKQLKALSVLGWNFGLHLLRAAVPRRQEDQAEKFRSYFRPDRITSFTPEEHLAILEFESCTLCGICSSHCRVMARSAGKFLGPEHLAASASRSQPEFASDAPSLYLCAVCGQCEPDCPEQVPVARMAMHMRSMIRRVAPAVMPQPIQAAAHNLAQHGNIYGQAPALALPRRPDAEFTLFLGCRERMAPERVQQRLKLLDHLAIRVTGVDESCCGGVPETLGLDPPPAVSEKILAAGPKKVLTVCPHCTEALRRNPALKDKVEVSHLAEVLAERIPSGTKARDIPTPVAFHDPCHLARGCGLIQEPREVLRRLGVELKEMAESGDRAPCCGAGGGLALVDPALGKEVARSRLADAKAAGAKTLITACAGCRDQLTLARSDGDPTIFMLEDILD